MSDWPLTVEQWEKAANAKRNQLHQMGFLSSEDARALAARRIRHRKNAFLGACLAARFAEVIVDEAQDCDDHQLAVLEWLRKAGTHVLTVCDPEQSIYEFRDVKPSSLAHFNSAAKPLSLTGNFRSAPPICTLSGTLRGSGLADNSVGFEAACSIPVHIRQYDPKHPQSLAAWFKEHLHALSISEARAAVLSHRATDALKVVGRHVDDRLTNVAAGLLLHSARTFQDRTTDGATRRGAVTQAEALLLRCLDASEGSESLPEAATDIADLVDLRTFSCELLASTPVVANDWSTWCAQVRVTVQSLPLPNGLSWRAAAIGTPRSVFPILLDSATSAMTAATVHSAKGCEFDAVLVVLPDKGADTESLLAGWQTGSESEAKRVVYVGVTRARKSVSLAIPTKHFERVLEILRLKNVPFVSS